MPWHNINVEKFAREMGLKKTLEAIKCSGEYFNSIKRKDGRDGFIHSYRVAQILIYHIKRAGSLGNLISIKDLDDILTAAFFHDVPEDVSWNALVDIEDSFGELPALFVWVLSRDKNVSDELYFFRIADFIFTALIKLADRLHNLRNMTKNFEKGTFFTKERLNRQIKETWEYIIPMALKAMEHHPEYKVVIIDMYEELLRSLAEAEYVLHKLHKA